MIDLHTHILPGIDDGARTLDESLAMARAAAADGISVVAATPHVRDDYPTSAAEMERGVARLNDALREHGIPVEVLPGGELALDRIPHLAPEELARFTLGGSGRYLLLEFPYYGWPHTLRNLVFRLETQGFTCVLAHPERNAEVQESPQQLAELMSDGTLVQLTAASLDGRLGRHARAAARALLDRGLAHLLASDAHAGGVRDIGMSGAAAAAGDAGLARWLTKEVPEAVASGAEAPPRPWRPTLRDRILRRR
jgi:protein-tyrosine phosphatase